jgi:hypothetical protein
MREILHHLPNQIFGVLAGVAVGLAYQYFIKRRRANAN